MYSDEILYKDMLRSVTGFEFSAMEVEVHFKCMDAFTTLLNKNEESRSPDHPNRLFLYVVHAVSKHMFNKFQSPLLMIKKLEYIYKIFKVQCNRK